MLSIGLLLSLTVFSINDITLPKLDEDIYCKMYGNCIFNNLTVIGTVFNVTVTNYNVTGNIQADGIIVDVYCNSTNCYTLEDLLRILVADNDWLYNDSTTMYFNESKLATIYYNATEASAEAGTIDGGYLNDTVHNDGSYDEVTFNFSETAGAPALDLRMNFTDITGFNGGVIRYKTSTLAGDQPIIQLWDYDNNEWEDYPPLSESTNFAIINQEVFDDDDHIGTGADAGKVQMRIYKASNGNTNNHYYVDWTALFKGYGTPSGNEVDPYSWHRGDVDSGNYNTTGDVIANDVCDYDGNCLGNSSKEYQIIRPTSKITIMRWTI